MGYMGNYFPSSPIVTYIPWGWGFWKFPFGKLVFQVGVLEVRVFYLVVTRGCCLGNDWFWGCGFGFC